MDQPARMAALDSFRNGDVALLIASDVAARGLDIPDVSHVFNFDVPHHADDYVHRLGRTGRAGKTGVAVTLVDWDELPRWSVIDKALDLDCPAPAETYSSSPHLYIELDIPTDISGHVGPAKKSPQRDRRRDDAKPSGRARSRQRTRGGKTATGHVETQPKAENAKKGAASEESTDSAHSGRRRRRRRPRQAAMPSALRASGSSSDVG